MTMSWTDDGGSAHLSFGRVLSPNRSQCVCGRWPEPGASWEISFSNDVQSLTLFMFASGTKKEKKGQIMAPTSNDEMQ